MYVWESCNLERLKHTGCWNVFQSRVVGVSIGQECEKNCKMNSHDLARSSLNFPTLVLEYSEFHVKNIFNGRLYKNEENMVAMELFETLEYDGYHVRGIFIGST